MKKVLFVMSVFFATEALYAEHIHLNSHTKCVCTRKRLEMTQAQLRTMQSELSLLEGSTIECNSEQLATSEKSRFLELKNAIKELEMRIPVMEKSLHALCKTIQ